jgi:cystathionine beta-lyase/cystathionine gamma-synthase
VLSVELKTKEMARIIVSKTKVFKNATSLGGVESLIEWRYMSDPSVSQTLCRISVGNILLND